MNTTSNAPARFEDALLPVLVEELEQRRAHAAPRPSPPRRRRTWTVAIGIAAAATAIALVIPAVWPGGPTGADPAAAAMLRKTARRAAAQPAMPGPGPGEFLYTKAQSFAVFLYIAGNGRQNFSFQQTLTRENWLGTDGSGRSLDTGGPVTFPTEHDRQAWIAAGSPNLDQSEGDETFASGMAYRDYSNLPTDPSELLQMIEARQGIVGGPPGDWETFEIIGDLLRETYTTPAVRSALFEVAADLPGVEFVGRTQDGSGRPGVAVAYTHEGFRKELIFDPQTAELLGENTILTEDSTMDFSNNAPGDIYGLVGKAGTVAAASTYLGSGVVGSTQDRPKATKAG